MAQSGQRTVTAAGTAVRMSASSEKGYTFIIKALSTNTGIVYLGNDGADDVTSANGYELAAGESPVVIASHGEALLDLNQWYLDSAVNGEGVSWLKAE